MGRCPETKNGGLNCCCCSIRRRFPYGMSSCACHLGGDVCSRTRRISSFGNGCLYATCARLCPSWVGALIF